MWLRVLATKCCRDALEVWKNEGSAIDFIVCDVVLPDGSGTDVAVAVSKERPDLQLLFCSGTELENWSQRDRWNLTQLGSLHWEFLAKPFHIRRFKELVRKMVNSRTMR